MLLSNRLTYCITTFIFLLAFAALPVMAQTIEATWSTDRNNDNTEDDPGWRVTIAGLEASDTVTVTYLDPAGTAEAATGTQAGFDAVASDATSTTGQIAAALGTTIAVQVAAGASGAQVTYQRVTFPAGGPGATLAATTLVRLPRLMDLAVSQYYVSYNEEVTVTFNFAAAGTTNGAPTAPLHISDVTRGDTTNWQVVRVSGTNQVTLRSTYAAGATSASTTIDLAAVYAQPTDPATDGQASVIYDDTAPTITDGTITVAAASLPAPPDGIWNKDFTLAFSVSDDGTGSGLPDEQGSNPVRIETDTDKLEVVEVGLGTQVETPAGTEYFVLMRPKADRSTTAGEEVIITVVPIDRAGNEGRGVTSVKLAASTPPPAPPAQYVSAAPASGNVMRDAEITVTFDKAPENLAATGAALSGTGATRTLTVPANAPAGALQIVLTWGTDSRQVLNYTVVVPDDPAVAFTSAAPMSGDIDKDQVITLTFAADPGDVTSSVGTVAGTGTTRTITLSNQAAGALTIMVSWTMAGHEDGSTTLTYNVPPPYVSPDPTSPANISQRITVPGGKRVILVRNKADTISSDNQPLGQRFDVITDDITGARIIPDAQIIEWSDMPNLSALFDRGAPGGGGALVLRKAVGDDAAPATGTVGISEIMWAIDAGYIGQTQARNSQWIELHNLNAEDKIVLIYAQTGAQFTDSNRVVTSTQAGDTLHGNPGGMVVDVVTNYFNGSNRGTNGWDIPGANGSSKVGINFVSMARKGTFDLNNKHDGKFNKRYVKTGGSENSSDGRTPGAWEASTVRYDRYATNHPDAATTDIPATYDFIGTPGRANTYTAATHITTAGRTNPNHTVIISEVANRDDSNKEYEWIELRNESTGAISLNNYQISIVTANKDDAFIYLPNNDRATLAPKGTYGDVLLLVASDPRDNEDHPLEVGWDVSKDEDFQPDGIRDRSEPPRYLVVEFGNKADAGKNGLPDHGKFILIVRSRDNKEADHGNGGKGRAELGNADLNRVTDVAGWADNVGRNQYPNAVSNTGMYPLHSFHGPNSDKNSFKVNTVHRRQHVNPRGMSGIGSTHNDRKDDQTSFRDTGYSGIGYKRQALRNNIHGGTPGYHDGVLKGKVADLADDATVVISEMMLTQGNERRPLPQWIELYNTSKTQAVNIGAGWKIYIETEVEAIKVIDFGAKGTVKTILPNQTVLVVSGTARSSGGDFGGLPDSTVFPATRVFNVHRELRNDDNAGFKDMSLTDPMVDAEVFNLRLVDGSGAVVDQVGNLDGNHRTRDNAKWQFPTDLTDEGYRSSLIRIFDDGVARDGVNLTESNVKPLGGDKRGKDGAEAGIDEKYSWVHAADTDSIIIYERHTWYGAESDWGTPALREGVALPVQLSSFRPTLEDGVVTVRWTTESELDNAGFNIYRSEERDGEFKQINSELIEGAGTTGERTAYNWVDQTAKPGVIYYYQIEDVSFAGERQPLAITKLKGLISAKNKLTTTWSELKEASQ